MTVFRQLPSTFGSTNVLGKVGTARFWCEKSNMSSKAFAFAGVTSRTTLIGVKVLGRDGSGSFGDILTGILWAADHGADVANMSLGGAFVKAGNGRFTSILSARCLGARVDEGVTAHVAHMHSR